MSVIDLIGNTPLISLHFRERNQRVLYCVTPGNQLAVTPGVPGTYGVQARGTCGDGYRPPRGSGLRSNERFAR